MFCAFVYKQEKSSWDCAFMQVPGRIPALLYYLFHFILTYHASKTTVERFYREDGAERSVLLAYYNHAHIYTTSYTYTLIL